MPQKVFFSTDMLPADLSDDAKAGVVYDMISEGGYPMDAERDLSRRFWGTFEQMAVGRLDLGQTAGTSLSATRERGHVARSKTDMFRLLINRSGSLTGYEGPGGDVRLVRHDVAIFASDTPGTLHMTSGSSMEFLTVPADLLERRLPARRTVPLEKVTDARCSDLLARYFDLVWATPYEFSPEIAAHVEGTLVDLIVLAFGNGGEREQAQGLRHARAADLIARIRDSYADPGFTATALARQVGLTPRYVSMLLSETGRGFSERVNDLRLDKAVTMLTEPGHSHIRISEIAYACGFNDISHFNRCFRRKFGCTPGSMR